MTFDLSPQTAMMLPALTVSLVYFEANVGFATISIFLYLMWLL